MRLPTEISNPVTGERIAFDEAASTAERLVWEEFRPADVEPPPMHRHPDTEERFSVTEGKLVADVDGDVTHLRMGDELVVPPETPHVTYTTDEAAKFSREVTPPGNWREALTDRFAVGHAVGELSGARRLLQMVLLVQAYPNVIVPERPSRAAQRVLFPPLAATARLAGLKSHYPYPYDAGPSRESLKRTVERYPRAVAAGEFDVIDEICTEDVVSHAPLGEPRGREALKEYEAPVHEAFPGFDVTIEDIVAEGDRVAMRLTIRGTHEGELMGVPATGSPVEFQNVVFHRMEDGRIAERWVQPDVYGLLEQLDANEKFPA